VTISGYGGIYRSGDIYWSSIKNNILAEINYAKFVDPIYGYHAVAGSILLSLYNSDITIDKTDRDYIISRIENMIHNIPEKIRRNYLYF